MNNAILALSPGFTRMIVLGGDFTKSHKVPIMIGSNGCYNSLNNQTVIDKEIVMLPEAVPEMPDVLDMDTITTLRSILDGGLDELLMDFINETPADIEKLYLAASQKDLSGLARLAHYLKGSGGNIGARTFSDLCCELELAAIEDKLINPLGQVSRIEQSFVQSKQAMQRLLPNKHL